MPDPQRIVAVINKSWEADPIINALLHEKVRPPLTHKAGKASFSDFQFVNHPFLIDAKPIDNPDPPARPRLTFRCHHADAEAAIEIWCLQDLMNPAARSSSSAEKWRVLPRIFAQGVPDLVIALGTAGMVDLGKSNGAVVIGSQVFIHNPYAENVPPGTVLPAPLWTDQRLNQLIASPSQKSIDFRTMADDVRFKAETRFLKTPIDPADPPVVLAGHGFCSLGVVNVVDYDHYFWADKRAVAAFRQAGQAGVIGSVETTHGLIRLQTEAPFLFVSGVTDDDGRFDAQVTPRVYAQNFVAAHNAGIALCYLLEAVTEQLAR